MAGNTARVLGWVEEELRRLGHTAECITVVDQRIGGCQECHACRRTVTEPGCALDDDGPAILERLVAADAIVYASPLFCWSWSAQLKALIDRHFCFVSQDTTEGWTSLLAGKRMALLITAAGPLENNADLLLGQFRTQAHYFKAARTSECVVTGCTTPEALGAEAQEQAAKLARELTA